MIYGKSGKSKSIPSRFKHTSWAKIKDPYTNLVLEAALRSLSSSEESSGSDAEHQLSSELRWDTVCCSVKGWTGRGATRRSHGGSSHTPERTRGSSAKGDESYFNNSGNSLYGLHGIFPYRYIGFSRRCIFANIIVEARIRKLKIKSVIEKKKKHKAP